MNRIQAPQSTSQDSLDRELTVVGEIQRSLLPERLPDIPGFDAASYYQPCALAGGDYFDIVPLAENMWGLVIADVAGHGVSATVIMAVMRALVHAHLPPTRYLPSNAFLEFINRQMTGTYTPGGRFVTVWCAVLDPVARRLTYASAGHNPPRLVRRGRVQSLDRVSGLPLGINESSVYEEISVELEPDDLLVIYTDGITEAMREEHGEKELFGTDRLDQILVEARRDSAAECVTRVTSAVSAFSRTRVPTDDQTMLVIRVNPDEQDPAGESPGVDRSIPSLASADILSGDNDLAESSREGSNSMRTKIKSKRTTLPSVKSPSLTEDDIRSRAREIYLERVGSGIGGNAVSDWLQAERELRTLRRVRG